jgi:hypothetical protein
MEKQKSNAQAILDKMKKKKEEVNESIPVNPIVTLANEVSTGQALTPSKDTTTEDETQHLPPVPSRTFNYWSKAPNTEIALSNKPAIKFNGNSYQTSDSHEISILDDMVKRIPNVFSKVG